MKIGRFNHEGYYAPATHFIRYVGSCWQEAEPGVQAVAHALTDLQLAEAEDALGAAVKSVHTNSPFCTPMHLANMLTM